MTTIKPPISGKDLKEEQQQQQATGFTIRGKIDYVIKMEGGDALNIDYNNSEEAILINLFGSLDYFRKLDRHARSKDGKRFFTKEEKRSIGITMFSLEKATEHFGKTAYAKMMETILSQQKKDGSNEQGTI